MNNQIMNQNDEELRGFKIHRTIYICVSILLVIVNFSVSPEFIWSLFPITGMGLGLFLHYYLGCLEKKKR